MWVRLCKNVKKKAAQIMEKDCTAGKVSVQQEDEKLYNKNK